MVMVAVIDVHTRYLLNWSIANTMEAEWDTAMISEAIVLHGKPEIIHRAIDPIAKASSSPARPTPRCSRKGGVAEGVHISAEGKGRAIDNVSIERFWRTLKHHHL